MSMCVPWESNPRPFVLLMQCSATEPQKHHSSHACCLLQEQMTIGSRMSVWCCQRTVSRGIPLCIRCTTATWRTSSSPCWTVTERSCPSSSTLCSFTCTWSWSTTTTRMKQRLSLRSKHQIWIKGMVHPKNENWILSEYSPRASKM